MLVEYETIAANKVRLYLRLRQYETALTTALDSGETELAFSVVVPLLHQILASQAATADASPTVVLFAVVPFAVVC